MFEALEARRFQVQHAIRDTHDLAAANCGCPGLLFGYDGYNLHLLDITTRQAVNAHLKRTYGSALEYITYDGLPRDLEFPL